MLSKIVNIIYFIILCIVIVIECILVLDCLKLEGSARAQDVMVLIYLLPFFFISVMTIVLKIIFFIVNRITKKEKQVKSLFMKIINLSNIFLPVISLGIFEYIFIVF